MRTKEEILDQSRADILSPQYGDTAHLWLEVRKIEVLIDIRDNVGYLITSVNNLASVIENKD